VDLDPSRLVLANRVIFVCGRATFRDTDITQIGSWLTKYPTIMIPKSVHFATWFDFEVSFNNASRVPTQPLALAVGVKNVFDAKKPDAWALFKSASRLWATDPRDQLYSLLGLVDIRIEANYSKSTEAVYLELATVMLERAPLDGWFRQTRVIKASRYTRIPLLLYHRSYQPFLNIRATIRISPANYTATTSRSVNATLRPSGSFLI
jgi:hypothetical protein